MNTRLLKHLLCRYPNLFGTRWLRVAQCLLGVGWLAGCAVNNQFPVAPYESHPQTALPALSVFYWRAPEEFTQACTQFDQASALANCELNGVNVESLATSLRSTGLFEAVPYGDKGVDYQLLVASAVYSQTGADELASAVAAGTTLMLAPVSADKNIKIDAVLTWSGVLLKRYQFSIPFTQNISLLSMSQDVDADIGESVASYLLQHFQRDDIFSPQALRGKLAASDYNLDLELPDVAGDFLKDGVRLYRHPYLGVQVRYTHEIFQYNYIDVFVYPIRQLDWQDSSAALRAEVGSYRREIEAMRDQGVIKQLRLDDTRYHLWRERDDGVELHVASIESQYVDESGVALRSHYYVFSQTDKFIKIRATYPAGGVSEPDVERFSQAIAKQIKAPSESDFMAQMRQRWRDDQSQVD